MFLIHEYSLYCNSLNKKISLIVCCSLSWFVARILGGLALGFVALHSQGNKASWSSFDLFLTGGLGLNCEPSFSHPVFLTFFHLLHDKEWILIPSDYLISGTSIFWLLYLIIWQYLQIDWQFIKVFYLLAEGESGLLVFSVCLSSNKLRILCLPGNVFGWINLYLWIYTCLNLYYICGFILTRG